MPVEYQRWKKTVVNHIGQATKMKVGLPASRLNPRMILAGTGKDL
jgi:hypothetical protein